MLKIALIAALMTLFVYVMAELWLSRSICELTPFNADRVNCITSP